MRRVKSGVDYKAEPTHAHMSHTAILQMDLLHCEIEAMFRQLTIIVIALFCQFPLTELVPCNYLKNHT